jgi:hypothetical protein
MLIIMYPLVGIHPLLQAFYAAVDSFHTAYDALTEFESLNLLASELVPGGWWMGG